MEKSGDFCRRVMEGTASEGAEYEGVMTMEEAYAEDCANLASCNVEGLLRHVSFSSELYGISSVEIQGGAGYHGNIVRIPSIIVQSAPSRNTVTQGEYIALYLVVIG